MNYSSPELFNMSKLYLCNEYIPGYVKYSYWSHALWTSVGICSGIGSALLAFNWNEPSNYGIMYRTFGIILIMAAVMCIFTLLDM